MKKTLYAYLIREIVSPFILGLFVFTFVLLMFQILKLTEMVVSHGVSILDVFRLIVYILPPFFVFTIPMSFLLAVLLAVGRLSSDSEITALKASGVSLYQIGPPVVFLSLVTYLLAFLMTVYGEPWGKQSLKELLFELGRTKATIGLKERIFNDEFEGIVLYVNRIHPKQERMEGIFVYDYRDEANPNVILARQGFLISDPYTLRLTLRLAAGSVHRGGSLDESYDVATFKNYDINLEFGSGALKEKKKTYLEMSIGELRDYIGRMAVSEDTYLYRRAYVEYHKKFAFPFASIIFAFLGIPLAIAPVRSGRSRGFTTSLLILVVYYLLFRMGETIGWRSEVHPAVVMWAPNMLLGAAGIYLFIKKANESDVKVLVWIDALAGRLRELAKRKL